MILNLSPLLSRFVNGRFPEVEFTSGIVTFTIDEQEYPLFSCIVLVNSNPINLLRLPLESSSRKDIERAFGCAEKNVSIH